MTVSNPYDFAIVIGINDYADSNKNLTSPVQDAKAVVDWLIDPNGGGLASANCKALYSYDGADGNVATQESIENLLIKARQFSRDLEVGNEKARRLYYYFSGHGISGGSHVLMCHAQWGEHRPNANLNADHIDNNYINPCTHFSESVFWLDCCRSLSLTTQQGALQIGCGFPRSDAGSQQTMMAFATKDNNEAYEALNDQSNNSVFTQALLTGLRQAKNNNGSVTWRSLAKYLEEYVPVIAAAENKSQTPVIHITRSSQDSDPVFCGSPPDSHITLIFNRSAGKAVIINGTFEQLAFYDLANGNLDIDLVPGIYKISLSDEEVVFSIDGTKEEVHVNF